MSFDIEILMATYNGEKYIAEQIASIQAQTYRSWTLLVSDDCSTDGTLEIVTNMAKDDSRIKVISHGRRFGGPIPNFFNLIHRSSAPYVMFCDQDDVWNEEKIEATLQEIYKIEERYGKSVPALVSTDVEVVDEELNTLKKSMLESERLSFNTFLPHSLVENNVIGCTAMANRALIDLANRQVSFDSMLMHDWWLNLIAQACGHSAILKTPTMKYRQHGDNAVGAGGTSMLDMILGFSLKRTCANWVKTVNQAEALLEYYSEDMSDSSRKIVAEYIELQTNMRPYNLISLLRSGYRSSVPIRIASQIISYLFRCVSFEDGAR